MAVHTDYIIQLLEKNGVINTPNTLPRLTMPKLKPSQFYNQVKAVYKDLGGLKADIPFDLNSFDMELFSKALIIDDATHFNPYRAKTLQSPLYNLLPEIDSNSYKRICRQHAKDCLSSSSHGELWTNKISERHFGESNVIGDLGLNGSAAWKMRAFVDFLTDVSGLIMPYKVVRVSIYDSLMVKNKITSLKDILLSRKEENEKIIYNYFSRKLGLVKKDIKQFMAEELKKSADEDPSSTL